MSDTTTLEARGLDKHFGRLHVTRRVDLTVTTGRIHAASDQGLTMSGLDLATLDPTPTDDRLEASLALATWCALLGVDVVRVHDVAPTVQAMKVVDARPSAQNR